MFKRRIKETAISGEFNFRFSGFKKTHFLSIKTDVQILSCNNANVGNALDIRKHRLKHLHVYKFL